MKSGAESSSDFTRKGRAPGSVRPFLRPAPVRIHPRPGIGKKTRNLRGAAALNTNKTMTIEGKNEGATQGEESEDALWRLLERAPQPKPVSPYFARRVLREVALLETTRPAVGGTLNWLARTWQAWHRQPRWVFAGALGAVTLLAVGGVGLSAMHWHSPAVPAVTSQAQPLTPALDEGDETIPPDAVADFDSVPQPTVALVSDSVVTAQDVEVIADLDNLLSREESRLWTEDDTARF